MWCESIAKDNMVSISSTKSGITKLPEGRQFKKLKALFYQLFVL